MSIDFRVTGLPYAQFAPLFQLTEAELAARGIVRQIAQKSPTSRYACRVSLCDAEAGEANPAVSYIHVHNAKHGCYAARIDRA